MKRILLAVLPLVLLVGLVAVFALNMDRDPSLVRSVLIDKPAPAFTLAAVAGTINSNQPRDSGAGRLIHDPISDTNKNASAIPPPIVNQYIGPRAIACSTHRASTVRSS